MRVLLDEQLPIDLALRLTDHNVSTVRDQGWKGLKNGELLARAAEQGFEIFLTSDRNLQHQQNLSKASLRIVVVAAKSNKLEDLEPIIEQILHAIALVRAGQIITVPLESVPDT